MKPIMKVGQRLLSLASICVILATVLLAQLPLAYAGQDNTHTAQHSANMFLKEIRQLYRLDKLPGYRGKSTLGQVSSYDRTGGNDDGFSGTYSYLRKEGDHLVLADLKGPGVINRIFTPTPTNKMIAFYFDGEKTPRIRVPFIDLFSGKAPPFFKPMVGNEIGGFYSYAPIPYKKSLKIVYEGNDIQFHQIQYRNYPQDTQIASLKLPISTDVKKEIEAVASLWRAAGSKPWKYNAYGPDFIGSKQLRVVEQEIFLKGNAEIDLFRQKSGGGRIVGIEIERNGLWGREVLLEARWDHDKISAIKSPVNDFFGYSFDKPATQGILLGSLAGMDYSYIPMPFDQSAKITLKNTEKNGRPISGVARIYYTDKPRESKAEGKLYTTWRRENPEKGKPYLILDTKGRGHYIGTILQSQGIEPGHTAFFEGDDVAVVDGELAIHGTGTEDYFNGGFYKLLDRWDSGVSLPIHGALEYTAPKARTGGYRFYLADKIPFEKTFTLTVEHGPVGNAVPVDYTSVAFFYADQPPKQVMTTNINSPLITASSPEKYIYTMLDLSIRLGLRTRASLPGKQHMVIHIDKSRTTRYPSEISSDFVEGMVRVDLSQVPSGQYSVHIGYEKNGEGGLFSVWRRQQQISDWVDTYSDEVVADNAYIGDVDLTEQIRSLTLRTRENDGRNALRISRIELRKKN